VRSGGSLLVGFLDAAFNQFVHVVSREMFVGIESSSDMHICQSRQGKQCDGYTGC
jgi:hypothetical protein